MTDKPANSDESNTKDVQSSKYVKPSALAETNSPPKRALEDDIIFPVISCIITLVIPIFGFLSFFFNRHLSKDSPRYIWFNRALCLGSALSVIYTFIICSYVHHYHTFAKHDDVLGYSYEM